MNATTRRTVESVLADRAELDRHTATVRLQLAEEAAKRRRQAAQRAVRTLSLSGIIRR